MMQNYICGHNKLWKIKISPFELRLQGREQSLNTGTSWGDANLDSSSLSVLKGAQFTHVSRGHAWTCWVMKSSSVDSVWGKVLGGCSDGGGRMLTLEMSSRILSEDEHPACFHKPSRSNTTPRKSWIRILCVFTWGARFQGPSHRLKGIPVTLSHPDSTPNNILAKVFTPLELLPIFSRSNYRISCDQPPWSGDMIHVYRVIIQDI